MAGTDKTVKVTLVAVATPYAKGMNDASVATRKLGAEIDTVGAKTKGLTTNAGKASGALKGLAIGAGAVAATGLVAFMTDTVKAAGDLQQSIGGVDAVFKDNAKTIHEFGATAAESVGLATNEFNQLATVTGALLKNKGVEDFTNQSINLVKVGADLAAQFGGPTSQAVDALNAALRGEADPAERYALSLNETAVNAQLAATNIQKVNGKFTEQQKTTARLALILQQSADATGAFAREADTLQGQQQRLTAEWANAKAELGTALLPALTDVTAALRNGVDVAVAAGHAWESIPGPVKAAIAALVIYKLTNDKVSLGVGKARDSIKRMREELALQQALAGGIAGGYKRLGDEAQVAGGKVSKASAALGVASKAARGAGSALLGAFGGPIGLAITGLTVAIGIFASKHAEAAARVEEFTDAIRADSGALAENTRAAAVNALEKDGALKAASALGLSLEDVTDATLGNAEATERLNVQMGLLQATSTGLPGDVAKVKDAIGGTNDEINEAVDAYERQNKAVGKVTTAQQGLAPVTDTVTESLKDQKKTVQDLAKQVLDLADAQLSAVDAQISYQAALDEVSAAIKENGQTATNNRKELDLTTEAGRANASALLDQATRAKEVAKANLESGDSLNSLRTGIDAARDAFIDNAVKMGLSRDAAKDMADEFGLSKKGVDNLAKSVEGLPASKQIKVEAETKAASAALAVLRLQLAGIKSKSVVVTATTRYVNTGYSPNGGRNTAGGSTFADGGHVRGPGTAKSDSIPAWLSNGEYVLRAAAVAKYGTGLLDQMNSMRFAEGGAVRYGSRQQVVTVPSGPTSQSVTNDARLMAEVVNIVAPNPSALRAEIRNAPYRAKGRPGR